MEEAVFKLLIFFISFPFFLPFLKKNILWQHPLFPEVM